MGRLRRFLALRAEFDTVGQKWWQVLLTMALVSVLLGAPNLWAYWALSLDPDGKRGAWLWFWGSVGAGLVTGAGMKLDAYFSRPVRLDDRWRKTKDDLAPFVLAAPPIAVFLFGGPVVYNLLPFLHWVCPMP